MQVKRRGNLRVTLDGGMRTAPLTVELVPVAQPSQTTFQAEVLKQLTEQALRWEAPSSEGALL